MRSVNPADSLMTLSAYLLISPDLDVNWLMKLTALETCSTREHAKLPVFMKKVSLLVTRMPTLKLNVVNFSMTLRPLSLTELT